ncbi:hypothetical protein PRIPAC_89116, partial [Pristionchus pacificus]|uniref:Apple domain-containing protein n=1 Tax=Pristionchus pacificus TaxID=54126 RepID=A0A2A6B8K1_PRIPA
MKHHNRGQKRTSYDHLTGPLSSLTTFPHMMIFSLSVILELVQWTNALTCFVSQQSTTVMVGIETTRVETKRGCEYACEQNADCSSFAHSSSNGLCVLHGSPAVALPGCSTPVTYTRWVKRASGCPKSSVPQSLASSKKVGEDSKTLIESDHPVNELLQIPTDHSTPSVVDCISTPFIVKALNANISPHRTPIITPVIPSLVHHPTIPPSHFNYSDRIHPHPSNPDFRSIHFRSIHFSLDGPVDLQVAVAPTCRRRFITVGPTRSSRSDPGAEMGVDKCIGEAPTGTISITFPFCTVRNPDGSQGEVY